MRIHPLTLVVALVAAVLAPEAASFPRDRLLAFQSDIGGDYEIYVTRVGERPRQLTHNRVQDRLPSWSHDGRSILFIRSTPDGVGSYWLMNADGSNQRVLGKVRTTKPPWSVWPRIRRTSPDGRWSVYGQSKTGALGGSGIYIRRTDGGEKPKKITDLYSPDPNWSTDGKWITFWTRDLPGGKTTSDHGLFNVWAVSPDGNDEILVARKAVRETWQP